MHKLYGLGLFVGRFQPFHKGHLYALKFAARSCKRLIVGIGSSQEVGTSKNPFSSRHRVQIIKAGLHGTGIDMFKLRFLEIPDFKNNDVWFNYIIKKVPDIEVVFSRNRLVKSIFGGHGIEVISPNWHKREIFHATKIRKMIRSGGRWRDRVPRGAINKIAVRKL